MTKLTLDLDVSDDLAARLADLPKEEINRYAVAALEKVVEEADETDNADDDEFDEVDYTVTEAEKAVIYPSLAISFAQADAGLNIPAEEVFARLKARAMERVGE